MLKSRNLPRDFGAGSSSASYTTVAAPYSLIPNPKDGSDEARMRAKTAVPNTSWNVPDYIGNEIFSSTDMRYKENACLHRASYVFNYRYACGYYQWVNQPNYRMYTYPWVRQSSNYGSPILAPTLDWRSVTDNLRAEAYWTMRPKLASSVDLLNSIIELKDFRDVAKYITPQRIGAALKRSRRAMETHKLCWVGGRRKSIRTPHSPPSLISDISTTASSSLLAKHLALDPLIADMGKIAMELQHLAFTKMRDMELYGVLGSRTHFVRELDPVQSLSLYGSYTNCRIYRGSTSKSVFRAHANLFYRYVPPRAFYAAMDFWGLSGSIEHLWNAMPWTFISDYFFGIGRSLHVMETDRNVSQVRFRDYTESLLTEKRAGYFIQPPVDYPLANRSSGVLVWGRRTSTYYPFDTSPVPVSGYAGESFQRVLANPYYGPALPTFKLPNGKQSANLLALARCFI